MSPTLAWLQRWVVKFFTHVRAWKFIILVLRPFRSWTTDMSWRGMLIKDNQGDWGICVAVWRGMKKGVPGVPGKWIRRINLANGLRIRDGAATGTIMPLPKTFSMLSFFYHDQWMSHTKSYQISSTIFFQTFEQKNWWEKRAKILSISSVGVVMETQIKQDWMLSFVTII